MGLLEELGVARRGANDMIAHATDPVVELGRWIYDQGAREDQIAAQQRMDNVATTPREQAVTIGSRGPLAEEAAYRPPPEAAEEGPSLMDRIGGGVGALQRGTANLIIGPGARNLEEDQRGPAMRRALLEGLVNQRLPANLAGRYQAARQHRQKLNYVDEQIRETEQQIKPDLPADQKARLQSRLDDLQHARAGGALRRPQSTRPILKKMLDSAGRPKWAAFDPASGQQLYELPGQPVPTKTGGDFTPSQLETRTKGKRAAVAARGRLRRMPKYKRDLAAMMQTQAWKDATQPYKGESSESWTKWQEELKVWDAQMGVPAEPPAEDDDLSTLEKLFPTAGQ